MGMGMGKCNTKMDMKTNMKSLVYLNGLRL